MSKPPVVATAILTRLGPRNESIVGDIFEEYRAGRSRLWFWRQVLSAVFFSAVREIGRHPVRTMSAIATGWAVLLLVFVLLGDRAANGLAKLVWNWERPMGYTAQEWWPFWITAAVVSYSGFSISAWFVARLYDRSPAMLVAYVTSVVVGLAASALIIEILSRRWGGVPVPHPLFYIVSVTLPTHWRSGFVLVPFVMLLCGLAAGRRVIPSQTT